MEALPVSSVSTATTGTTRGRGMDIDHARAGRRETKPFFRTSEFWVYAAATAAVLIFGYSGSDEMNTFRTWLLVSVLSGAYILTRGLSKSGSREGWRDGNEDNLG
jgi:hypothetical protein